MKKNKFIVTLVLSLSMTIGLLSPMQSNAADLTDNIPMETATCSHTWSAWSVYSVTDYPGPTFDSCVYRETTFIRGCTKCGKVGSKKAGTQLSHSWKK